MIDIWKPLLVLFGAGLFALAIALWASCADAHDWYPKECCEESHCHPVDCNEITGNDVDMIWRGTHFPKAWVKAAPDGGCHVCIIPSITGAGKPVGRCMFLGMIF